MENCPHCNSDQTIKKGLRKNKLQKLQRHYCKNCKKFFIQNQTKNKTYPLKLILRAISFYNLGYSLEKTQKAIKNIYKITPTLKTIHNWLNELKDISTYSKIRNNNLKYHKPKDIIVKKTFRHNEQPYRYQYHNSKINFLKQVHSLKQYLIGIRDNCLNNLFQNSNKNKASQLKINLNFDIERKQNQANRLASLVLSATNNNQQRHQIIQDFMLINDTATIATEVPIFYLKTGLTGHIDILQFKFNKIHI